MLNLKVVASLLVLLGLVVSGCRPERAENSVDRIRVVATTGIVADLAKKVGGPWVEVEALMGTGVDPHQYKASPGDVRKLAEADVVMINGLHLEGKMGEVLENLSRTKAVVEVTAGVPRSSLLKTGAGNNAYDPHVWFDVTLWSTCVNEVGRALSAKVPERAKFFQDSADAYRKELLALHEEVRQAIAQIPKDRRVLITAHDAFQYFGRAYGMEVKGIQGISTESEAGLAEINSLVNLIVARQVKAVFVESSVSQKNVQALVEGARQRSASVTIGGQLFSDALGEKGTAAGDYVGMVRENVKTLVEALR